MVITINPSKMIDKLDLTSGKKKADDAFQNYFTYMYVYTFIFMREKIHLDCLFFLIQSKGFILFYL